MVNHICRSAYSLIESKTYCSKFLLYILALKSMRSYSSIGILNEAILLPEDCNLNTTRTFRFRKIKFFPKRVLGSKNFFQFLPI